MVIDNTLTPPIMTDKAIETNAKRVLDLYILADTVEVKQDSSQDLYPLLDNYENHIKDAAARQKMTAYVNLNPEARQIVSGFFLRLVAELNAIEDASDLAGVSLLKLPDSVERDIDGKYAKPQDRVNYKTLALDRERFKFVVEQVDANNDPCVTKFMHEFITKTRINPESILAKESDSENYFKAKLDGLLRKYKNNDLLITLVGKFFDAFLKSLAHVISRFIWFDHKTITKDILFGLLYSHDMSFDIISELSGKIRERPPPKKKPAKEETKEDGKPAAAGEPAPAPAAAPVETKPDAPAPAEAKADAPAPAPAPNNDPLNLGGLLN